MYTRDSAILSRYINRIITDQGSTLGSFFKPTFSETIEKLFKNGEQGFFYDPNDLSTMFRDAAGTIPVTGAGQAVGLMLDKSKGFTLESNLVLGDGKNEDNELHVTKTDGNGSVSELSLNAVNPLSGSKDVRFKLTAVSSAGGLRPVMFVGLSQNPTVGNFYQFSFKYKVLSGTAKIIAYHSGYAAIPVNYTLTGEGTFKIVMGYLGSQVVTPTLYFGDSLFDMQMDDFEYRRIKGNHAYQATSSARPILRDAPRRIDFDAVDDKLITNLPTQVTGCTVIRSVPNVGTQILTGQTIPATYNDNTDHCGLIVINRALTPIETSVIATEFNKRAGV